MRRWWWVLGAAALLLGSCAYETTQLAPAFEAARVPGNPHAAEASIEGVHVVVDGDRWKSTQPGEELLSPVFVTIENRSSHPLRLRYDAFTLGAKGFRFAALPPVQVYARQEIPAYTPSFAFQGGFYTAPWWGPYYQPYITPWVGSFAYDPLYYNRYYGMWPGGDGPSREVLRKAIPEGVLEPGASVAGFVYFEDLRGQGPEVAFRAALVDAQSGQPFGQVEIPFLLVRDGKVVSQR